MPKSSPGLVMNVTLSPEIQPLRNTKATLQQSGFNNHYMIFKDDKMVMHCQHTKKLDQKGAEEAIDFYIDLVSGKYDKEKEQKNGC